MDIFTRTIDANEKTINKVEKSNIMGLFKNMVEISSS
jgi:hypothetical protein